MQPTILKGRELSKVKNVVVFEVWIHTQCEDVRVRYVIQLGCDHQRCQRTLLYIVTNQFVLVQI